MEAFATAPQQGWQARLELELQRRESVTRLSRCRHNGPLYLQKPFYPEGRDLAHLYLLHPPGGIVSGDELEIDISVGAEAAALVTTPGAARIYRARSRDSCGNPRQLQRVQLRVAEGASLEWFPLETIVYNDSCVSLQTNIDLAESSRLFAWEVTCFGLPASGQRFESGSFQQRYLVKKKGVPLFIDQLQLDDGNRHLLQSTIGMAGHAVSGFFLAGPFESAVSDELQNELRQIAEQQGLERVGAVSRVGELLIGRYLGGSAEQARKLFSLWWKILRPQLIGREACAPRIWLT